MAIDFFEAQEAARRRSGLLILLFVAAILAIVAVVYTALHITTGPGAGPVDLGLLGMVTAGVLLVVGTGSVFRTASLRRGGPAVAELLGGRRVQPDTDDLEERTLLNVVEEMAIASGTPVPAIYVLDGEEGINAFAAGYTIHDAAVAVTRGGLRRLSRDELQGVIAHEFSHILNGDMRVNIRLIGVLYGILLLAVIGRGILYAGPRGGGRRGRGGGGWIVLLGFVLLLVGYVGVFFGKMIKSAVSRQREYLADSSAVEFTRNPDGLAGALRKIGGEAGSLVRDPHAEELSHLFFAGGVRGALGGLLSTHPPLADRIRRLDPAWSGSFDTPDDAVPRGSVPGPDPPRLHGQAAAKPDAFSAVELAGAVAAVGAPTPGHLAYAGTLLRTLPEPLVSAAHDPKGARALVLALILVEDDPVPDPAWAAILSEFGADTVERARALLPPIAAAGMRARLPLLDLALPALMSLPESDAASFTEGIDRVVRADGRIRLFEFALLHTLARRLGGPRREDRGGRGTRRLAGAEAEVALLVSAIAWVGSGGKENTAEEAFRAGRVASLPDRPDVSLQPRNAITLDAIDQALGALESVEPAGQRRVLEGCARAAAHDGHHTRAESELLRAIAESLDCPMPPLLDPGETPPDGGTPTPRGSG